jgi:hypothetical protein
MMAASPDDSHVAPDGWRPLEDMPEDLKVLFIEGYSQVSWMETHMQRKGYVQGVSPFAGIQTFWVWCTKPDHQLESRPDTFGLDRCIEEIESGLYHAIVVVNFSNPERLERFETELGKHLQTFVKEGGVIAFLSSEGLIVKTFNKLFDVS